MQIQCPVLCAVRLYLSLKPVARVHCGPQKLNFLLLVPAVLLLCGALGTFAQNVRTIPEDLSCIVHAVRTILTPARKGFCIPTFYPLIPIKFLTPHPSALPQTQIFPFLPFYNPFDF